MLDGAVKQIKYVRALKDAGYTAGEAYIISKIPVTPPIMRPISPSRRGGELQIADANHLYLDTALASKALESAKEAGLPDEDLIKARQHVYDTTSALFGLREAVSPRLKGRATKGYIERITGSGSPKSGFLHKNVLKRQQDLSGRATAVPDVNLNMDQAGVPEDMLWTMYEKFVMKGLIGTGYAPAVAKEMLDARHPAAKAVLDAELLARPVLLNRAPTLHKHSIIATYAVPTQGKSVSVNPFIEKSMNLDYDGDALTLHVPVGDAAVREAQQMTISKLLFTDKNRDALAAFPQHEAIIGAYLATRPATGAVKKFKTKEDAVAAYRKGEIAINTPVSIG